MSDPQHFTIHVSMQRTYELTGDGTLTIEQAEAQARERFAAAVAAGEIEVTVEADNRTGLCLVRNKLGGSEEYDFATFAEWGAPDEEIAVEIAQWLLAHPDQPYELDDSEPDCYERYRVTDTDALARQLQEWTASHT